MRRAAPAWPMMLFLLLLLLTVWSQLYGSLPHSLRSGGR